MLPLLIKTVTKKNSFFSSNKKLSIPVYCFEEALLQNHILYKLIIILLWNKMFKLNNWVSYKPPPHKI